METAKGRKVTIHFDGERCIHSRQCVLGLPGVFKANVQGPWIDADAASVEAIVAVAHACPSGAIRYERHDGGPAEAAPQVNTGFVRENGPVALHAELRINGAAAGTRATLCRCGASANKPYCDGSHAQAGFQASGEPPTRPSEPLDPRGGPLDVTALPNGPLQVNGPLELCSGTGRTIERKTAMYLCRCGASANKPYCDGSHKKVGFTAG
jgi:CDGSH-type Zn-finger protein/uncharacterized Fe-S cluster protein YjdI